MYRPVRAPCQQSLAARPAPVHPARVVVNAVNGRWARWTRRGAWSAFAVSVVWMVFAEVTLLRPPRDLPPAPQHRVVRDADGTRRYGPSYVRRRGHIWEVGLVGDPVELGDAHGVLLREPMIRIERRMMSLFAHYVPSAALRSVIATLVRGRNYNLDHNYPRDRLFEIAAEARAFAPGDPFARFLPTYHRMVLLHALYDVSLSFEHSPLIGCSSLFASGIHTVDGHTYVGRNFDMEVDSVFDEEKAVMLVRARGRIPFASVGWPGLTGVLTGMNAAGIFVAVHGARAGTPRSTGVPVPTTLRNVLERAHSLDEAIAIVRADEPMVSHRLIVVDGDAGRGAVLERAPGFALAVRDLGGAGGIANHFATASLASSPRDIDVRRTTSTLLRQSAIDERVRADDGRFDASGVLRALRDRGAPGATRETLGNRGAIDAWIATHSVVADATRRILWVSEGPHTLGRYIEFDLGRLLGSEFGHDVDVEGLRSMPADPAFLDGSYGRWNRAHAAVGPARDAYDHHRDVECLRILDAASASLTVPDMESLELRARVLTRLGRRGEAVLAWQRYLASQPPAPSLRDEARRALGALGATEVQALP